MSAALNSISSGTVTVPPGTYLMDQVSVPAGVTLDLSSGATLKLKGGTGNPLLRVFGRVVGPGTLDCSLGTNAGVVVMGDDVVLDGFTVLNASTYGVAAGGKKRSKIRNVTVTNPGGTGIFTDDSGASAGFDGPTITGCTVDKSSQAAGTSTPGIQVIGNSFAIQKVKITNNTVLMPMSATAAGGICITPKNCPKVVVTGNSTSGGYMGISLDTCTGGEVANNDVTGAAKYGIETPASTRVSVVGNTIDMANGVSAAATGQVGIEIDGSSTHFAIGSNTIYGLQNAGAPMGIVVATSGSVHFTVTGNDIELPNNGSAIGIQVNSGCSNFTIGNNSLLASGGGAPYGILITNATDVAITGNQFEGFANNEIGIVGNSSFVLTRWTITGNVGSSSSHAVVVTALSGGATVGTRFMLDGNYDMATTRVFAKAGAPVDGDFAIPQDGLLAVDTTNNKIYVRTGGVWKGVVVA